MDIYNSFFRKRLTKNVCSIITFSQVLNEQPSFMFLKFNFPQLQFNFTFRNIDCVSMEAQLLKWQWNTWLIAVYKTVCRTSSAGKGAVAGRQKQVSVKKASRILTCANSWWVGIGKSICIPSIQFYHVCLLLQIWKLITYYTTLSAKDLGGLPWA